MCFSVQIFLYNLHVNLTEKGKLSATLYPNRINLFPGRTATRQSRRHRSFPYIFSPKIFLTSFWYSAILYLCSTKTRKGWVLSSVLATTAPGSWMCNTVTVVLDFNHSLTTDIEQCHKCQRWWLLEWHKWSISFLNWTIDPHTYFLN